jgi:hypothetical protein
MTPDEPPMFRLDGIIPCSLGISNESRWSSIAFLNDAPGRKHAG